MKIMATIEQFNAEIENVKRDYHKPVVLAMYPNGQRTVFPMRFGKGLGTFQATARQGIYDHVALIYHGGAYCRTMAIWHKEPAPALDAPAQAEVAPAAVKFREGDNVILRADAPVTTRTLKDYQRAGMIGIVRVPANHKFGVTVSFSDDSGDEYVEESWIDLYPRGDAPEAETKSIAEAGPGYTWTPEELAQYSPDNPYPPYTPGASADATIVNYEYEVAALKQQVAERDATIARLREVLKLTHDYIYTWAGNRHEMLTAINEVANAADALNGTGA